MRILLVSTILLACQGLLAGQDADRDDRKAIMGVWSMVAYDLDGKPAPADLVKKMTVTIQADKITIRPKIVAQNTPILKDGKRDVEVTFKTEDDKADEIGYRLNPAKNGIEILGRGGRETSPIKGLYGVDGDEVKICFPLGEKKQGKKFPDQPKSGYVRMIMKRVPSK